MYNNNNEKREISHHYMSSSFSTFKKVFDNVFKEKEVNNVYLGSWSNICLVIMASLLLAKHANVPYPTQHSSL